MKLKKIICAGFMIYALTHAAASFASYELDKDKSYVEHLINWETFPLSGLAYLGIVGFGINTYILSQTYSQSQISRSREDEDETKKHHIHITHLY